MLHKSIQMHKYKLIADNDGAKYQTLTTKKELCAVASKSILEHTKDKTAVSILRLKAYLTIKYKLTH